MRPALAITALFALVVLVPYAAGAALVLDAGQAGTPPPLPSSLPTPADLGLQANATSALPDLVHLQVGADLRTAPDDTPTTAIPPDQTAPAPPAFKADPSSPNAASRPAASSQALDLGEVAEVATLVAAAAWLLSRLLRGEGWRGLPLAALFTRLRADRLMDNKVRAQVHEAILQHPGASVEQVRATTGIARTTATHHLRRLERHGLVTTVQQGARRRYFVASVAAGPTVGSPSPARLRDAAALSHPTARGVAAFLLTRPGVDQREVCDALAIRNPNASKHLSRFEELGLVVTERRGRNCHYFPTDGLRLAMAILVPAVQATTPGLLAGAHATTAGTAGTTQAFPVPTVARPEAAGLSAPARAPTEQVTPTAGA